MAYKLASKPNTSAPTGTYPFGNIKDDDGTGNGTPLNSLVHADFHQFFAKLLSLGAVVGNDLPENDVNGYQFHTALQNIINASVVGLLDLKGNIDCSSNPNYPSALKGDCYVVTVAGKIGGASGLVVAVGDFIICKTDNAGGTQASVGTSWFIVERNLDQATSSVAGIAKLYTDLSASNTDGAPDQGAVVTGIAALSSAIVTRLGTLNFVTINIGDWNMDSTTLVTIAHGLTLSKIREVSAMIISDGSGSITPLISGDAAGTGTLGGGIQVDSTNVSLIRTTSGFFDNTNFDATSFNRGYILIKYID